VAAATCGIVQICAGKPGTEGFEKRTQGGVVGVVASPVAGWAHPEIGGPVDGFVKRSQFCLRSSDLLELCRDAGQMVISLLCKFVHGLPDGWRPDTDARRQPRCHEKQQAHLVRVR